MNGLTDFDLAQKIWDYMRFEQPIEKADIIIGLGSTDIRTAQWCASLYHDGYASKILFTGARGRITRDVFTDSEADVYAREAERLGVPGGAILKESTATNTGENITHSYELLQESDIRVKSIIIVTKPYMLRRAYATFMKQWPNTRKPKMMCSAIDVSFEEYCKDDNYPFEYVTNVMVGDLQRIQEYPKRGFQIEQYVPDDVMQAWSLLVARGYTKHLI